MPDVQITDLGTLPATAMIQSQVTVPVTLFNAGTAPARDAAVYLRDKKADLARSNPILIQPGASTTVQLTFTVNQGGEMTGIAVDAFCANDADPNSNHAELGNLKVVQQPGGGGPKGPHHLDDIVIKNGGVLATTNSNGSTTTTSDPGSIQIVDMGPPKSGGFGSVVTGGGFGSSMTGTSGSSDGGAGGGVIMMGQTGGGSGGAAGTAGAGTTAGSGGGAPKPAPTPGPVVTPPINMTLTNPFSTAFQYAVATLFVEGQKIASRSLGTVLPGTNRTVSFTEWKATKAGTYKIRVDLEGMGSWSKKLKSSATGEVTVGSSPQPTPVAVRPLTPSPTPASPAQPGMSMGGQPRPVFQTRNLTPYVRPGSSGLVPRVGVRGGMGGVGGVRGLGVMGPLGLTANSILVRPFPAAVGAPLDVSVQLANRDATPAGTVSVQVFVDGEDLGSVSVAVPASGSAIASGFKSWTAKSGRHDFRAVVIAGEQRGEATKAVLVNAAGAGPFAGRPMGGVTAGTMSTGGGMKPGGMTAGGMSTGGMTTGTMTPSRPGGMTPVTTSSPFGGRPGPGMSMGPDLQVTATDIKIAPPAPAQGTAAVINVTVRNLGAALATDGKVLLVLHADGKEIERKQFPAAVAARGMLALTWPITAPAGALSVSATATVTGDGNPNNNNARSGIATAPKTMTTPIRVAPTTTTTMSR